MVKALTKSQKLSIIIGISFTFFLAEIAVGFYTHSLALVADAFHYFNDLLSFIVALVAFKASERDDAPPELSFGWQRATLLGAFFNGVFLLALGVSIFLQAIERFVSLQEVQNPRLVMIVGCVGFALNVLSATILHEHSHDVDEAADPRPLAQPEQSSLTEVAPAHQDHRHQAPGKDKKKTEGDLGTMGVLLHVIGDAANNVGVVIAGAVIWKTNYPGRFYADPAVSVAIALMIFISSIPLVRKSGIILLQSVPKGVNPKDVKHDIEQACVPGVLAVHELHIWRLNQEKSLASVHVVVRETAMSSFMSIANTINECLHAYGIHSVTLQPELHPVDAPRLESTSKDSAEDELRKRVIANTACKIGCTANQCEEQTCCD